MTSGNNSEMDEENKRLKQEVINLQHKITEILSNKSKDNQLSQNAKGNTDTLIVELESKLHLVEGERTRVEDQVELLRKELAISKDEIKKKVSQLTQVANMKKMIVDKNN